MKHLLQTVLVALGIALGAGAFAQNYPTKSIRLMMPNAPGSANDTLTRVVAMHMSEAAVSKAE